MIWWVIKANLSLVTCHCPLVTCHLALVICHLSLFTWYWLYYTPGVTMNPKTYGMMGHKSKLVICHLSLVPCHLSLGIDSIILLESQGFRKHMKWWVIKANLSFVTCNLSLVMYYLSLATYPFSLYYTPGVSRDPKTYPIWVINRGLEWINRPLTRLSGNK